MYNILFYSEHSIFTGSFAKINFNAEKDIKIKHNILEMFVSNIKLIIVKLRKRNVTKPQLPQAQQGGSLLSI